MNKNFLLWVGMSLLSGCVTIGPKAVPPTPLLTLMPTSALVATAERSAQTNKSLVVITPLVSQALAATRIPIYSTTNQISYLKDGTWAEAPAHLFKALVIDTISARTPLIVLDPQQPGSGTALTLSGRLVQFGVDEASGKAIVTYDALLSAVGSKQAVARRFQAQADVGALTGANAGQALNSAANAVAAEIATWVATN